MKRETLGQVLGYVVLILAPILLSYIVVGFVVWNFNVATWDWWMRGMMVFMIAVIAALWSLARFSE